MGHYSENYEERDRKHNKINAAYKNREIEEEISNIRSEFLESIPKDAYSKGWRSDLVEKLAACRVHRFREDELNELLTEIVKYLHKK
jgi:hypothetical protein